jgi:hypothetical protein
MHASECKGRASFGQCYYVVRVAAHQKLAYYTVCAGNCQILFSGRMTFKCTCSISSKSLAVIFFNSETLDRNRLIVSRPNVAISLYLINNKYQMQIVLQEEGTVGPVREAKLGSSLLKSGVDG